MTVKRLTVLLHIFIYVKKSLSFCDGESAEHPVLIPNLSSTYLCAVGFEEADCKGKTTFLEDDPDKIVKREDGRWPGSLVVQPGCSLLNLQGTKSMEDYVAIDGVRVVENLTQFLTQRKGIDLISCGCRLPKINCDPVEAYEPVVVCDSLVLDIEVECPYERVVGTEFPEPFQRVMNLDAKLTRFFNDSLLNKFTSLEVSDETQYDWFNIPHEIRWPLRRHPDLVIAPPGVIHVVEQLVGRCGETTIRTEMFRIVRG